MRQTYTLLGPEGSYESELPGTFGGNGLDRIYGRFDCHSALRALTQGDTYRRHRVFFKDEATAIACGFRPCGNCMRAEYRKWKGERSAAGTRPTPK